MNPLPTKDRNKKEEKYQRIYSQLIPLLGKTNVPIAKMATINALLHHKIPYFFWTGFYLLQQEDLIVGPYQGPLACQVLQRHKGVCWAAIDEKKTILVPDVHAFPGHIACDSRSQSEIAVPVFSSGKLAGVMDVDSKELNSFDETDVIWLEKICKEIYK